MAPAVDPMKRRVLLSEPFRRWCGSELSEVCVAQCGATALDRTWRQAQRWPHTWQDVKILMVAPGELAPNPALPV